MRLVVLAALGLLASAQVSWAAEDPPALVALTLDTSGSIRPELIEQTRALAISILEGLPAGSEVALFVFDDTSRMILGRTKDPEAVRAALAEVKRAGRYTALYDALYDASRYLAGAPRSRKAIVLVTDGKDENSTLVQEDGLKVATTNRIPVFAVGIGRVEEAVLARISKLTEGDFSPMNRVDPGHIAARIAALEPSGVEPAVVSPQRTAPPPPLSAPQPRTPGGVPVSVIALIAASILFMLFAALILIVRLRPRPQAGAAHTPFPDGAAGHDPTDHDTERHDDDAAGATVLQQAPMAETVERTVVLRTQASIKVNNGPAAGRVLKLSLGRAVTIGRSPTNDLEVADPSVSSEHCRVKPEDEGYVLYDARSTNGTLVNGQQISRQNLRHGDVITIGTVNLSFVRE